MHVQGPISRHVIHGEVFLVKRVDPDCSIRHPTEHEQTSGAAHTNRIERAEGVHITTYETDMEICMR